MEASCRRSMRSGIPLTRPASMPILPAVMNGLNHICGICREIIG